MDQAKVIFKYNSQTFYYCSKFFPKHILEDVVILYAFTRTVDNFIDSNPPQTKKYFSFKQKFYKSLNYQKTTNNFILESFIDLCKKFNFQRSWIDAFFTSMEMDLSIKKYDDQKLLNKYMYGSSQVIGLMMSKVMKADKRGDKYARKLGQAFQLINFIRDLKEDLELGRIYFSQKELNLFRLSDPTFSQSENFEKFIRFQIKKFLKLINGAKKGLKYIPKESRKAIELSANIYIELARKIYANPKIVLEAKYKNAYLGQLLTQSSP